jgi:hypothetical protein
MEAGRPDATVEGGADSGGKDGGPDATVEDAGGPDSTAMDTGGDSASTDTGAADAGDAASDTSLTDTGVMDAGADGNVDSGVDTGMPDSGTDSATEASVDSGIDAAPDTGAGQGPACRAVDGGIYRCNAGQHCCANAMTQASSCATACDADAGTYPVDCAGSTGAGQCGSQLCCGTLVINGGTIPPMCTASQLTAACAPLCGGDAGDNPPAGIGACTPATHTIRLCTAAADCAGDPNGNTRCCSFNGNPIRWCIDSTNAVLGSCL